MLPVGLFILAVVMSGVHARVKEQAWGGLLLRYLLLWNVGVLGLLAAYAHTALAAETAEKIGWQPGSPFQFEVAMANLSYGILGILAFWKGYRFAEATVIGWSVLLLGCLVGHVINWHTTQHDAPYTLGVLVWFNDLFLPFLALLLLMMQRKTGEFE